MPARRWTSGTATPAGRTSRIWSSPPPWTDLRDQIGVGYLPGTGTLPIADLRRIACDCKIIPVLLGSAGQPLDVGRTTRTITPAQRIALNLRDQGCRHPDCHRPPADCDAHHVIHWLDLGPTNLNNLILLCRGHHTRHHKGEFTITAHGNQQFTITKTPCTGERERANSRHENLPCPRTSSRRPTDQLRR